MLREAKNEVTIEGILSEVDIKEVSYMKQGRKVEALSGAIKIKVNQKHGDEIVPIEIPVSMFANRLKNNGDPNPAYESIKRVKDNFVSIAASAEGEKGADRVRITNGSISMNEYISKTTGQLVSFPRITASFVSKIRKEDCKDQATFSVEMYVLNSDMELDKEGSETGRFAIKGVIPIYGGRVEVVPFYAESPAVINAVSQYWQIGTTIKASGRLNFSSTTETVLQEVDFGEPIESTRTVNVSDLIVTGGSQAPMDDSLAFNPQEIQTALAARANFLDEKKKSAKNKSTNQTKPAPMSNRPTAADLGF